MAFEDAEKRALEFRDERDWKQFHNPKDLAISINLEAAELLECFQWSGEDIEVPAKRKRMSDELADVLIYCIYMADSLGLVPSQIVLDKIARNEEKYPAEKARGNARKYSEL